MARGNKHGGYTLIEVMIFLAVSGLLFLIAALAINGKQSQADFFLGVGDFKTKLDDVINDISTGYYPDAGGSYQCSYRGGSAGNPITFTAGTNTTQAKHKDCVFLGKVLYFDVGPPSGPGTPNFSVITVAGGRLNSLGADTTSLAQAHPVAVDSRDLNLTVGENLDRGLVVTQVFVNGAPESAFGIFTSLPQASASLVSGALTSDILAIPGSSSTDTLVQTNTNIGNLDAGSVTFEPTVVICLRLGTIGGAGARRAAIIVGAHDRQITTEQHIGDVDQAVVTNLTSGNKCQ